MKIPGNTACSASVRTSRDGAAVYSYCGLAAFAVVLLAGSFVPVAETANIALAQSDEQIERDDSAQKTIDLSRARANHVPTA